MKKSSKMLKEDGLGGHIQAIGRFSSVLNAAECGGDTKLADTVVYQDDQVVVCPTVGSFLPNWFLIIPRRPALNFEDWSNMDDNEPIGGLVRNVAFNAFPHAKNMIWFEHGPSSKGSITGCGVDYAHIHLILDSDVDTKSLLSSAITLGELNFAQRNVKNLYEARDPNSEYLAFGDLDTGYFANLKTPVGSQFFRRALAEIIDKKDVWDYRKFPCEQNIIRSIEWAQIPEITGR